MAKNLNEEQFNQRRNVFRSSSVPELHEPCDEPGPLVESSCYENLYPPHRTPRDVREYRRAPTPPPVIHNFVERALTPEPDVFETVIVRPQPRHIINRIIERPITPPPILLTKEVSECARPPIVTTRVVEVCPSYRRHHVLRPLPRTRFCQSPADNYIHSFLNGGFNRSSTVHYEY